MNNTLNFDTALEILENTPFGSCDAYMGAVLFVAEAFDMSLDSVLEMLDGE